MPLVSLSCPLSCTCKVFAVLGWAAELSMWVANSLCQYQTVYSAWFDDKLYQLICFTNGSLGSHTSLTPEILNAVEVRTCWQLIPSSPIPNSGGSLWGVGASQTGLKYGVATGCRISYLVLFHLCGSKGPARRHCPFRVSWVCPKAFFWLGMPETPTQGPPVLSRRLRLDTQQNCIAVSLCTKIASNQALVFQHLLVQKAQSKGQLKSKISPLAKICCSTHNACS